MSSTLDIAEKLVKQAPGPAYGNYAIGDTSAEIFLRLIKELREVRAELEALKESKFTVPDGYRVMLIHESE